MFGPIQLRLRVVFAALGIGLALTFLLSPTAPAEDRSVEPRTELNTVEVGSDTPNPEVGAGNSDGQGSGPGAGSGPGNGSGNGKAIGPGSQAPTTTPAAPTTQAPAPATTAPPSGQPGVALVQLDVNVPAGASRAAVVSVDCVQGETPVTPSIIETGSNAGFEGWDGATHLVAAVSADLELRVPEFATCTIEEVVSPATRPLEIDVSGAPLGCVLLPGARGVQIKAASAGATLALNWAE